MCSPFFPYRRNQNGQQEYGYWHLVKEDDSYYICVVNKNPRSIILAMTVKVSSTMYDTSNAKSKCSTIYGLCQIKLVFPSTQQFVVLTTPNSGDINGWLIEVSFVGRVIIYIMVLGIVVAFILLILKYLGAWEEGQRFLEEAAITPADPLAPEKSCHFTYGTNVEDAESGRCRPSEDLYDGKICAICYEEQRNCFFVPCGHCATCYECAQRIMDVENKVCPICRRFIHKVRRLITP